MAGNPFGGAVLAVTDGIKHQLDAGGDSKFIEDPKHIFLYGMFTEPEFLGDFTICKSFGHECDNLLLARSEKVVALNVDNPKRRHLAHEVDEVGHLLGSRPDLSLVNNLYALAKGTEWGVCKTEQSACARAKGAYHKIAVAGFEQEDLGGPGISKMQATKQSQIVWFAVLVVKREHCHVGRGLGERFEHEVGFERTGTEPKFRSATKCRSE
jgi:hypothetical protein